MDTHSAPLAATRLGLATTRLGRGARELCFLAAAKLYELGRFTASQAARLAQMDRLAFLSHLSQVGFPAINLGDEEVDAEVEAAHEIAG